MSQGSNPNNVQADYPGVWGHVVGRTQEDAGQEQQPHQAGAEGTGEEGHPGAEQEHQHWVPSSLARRLFMSSPGQGQESTSANTKKLVLSTESKSPKRTKTNKRAQKPRDTVVLSSSQGDMKASGAKVSPEKEPWQGQDGKAHSQEVQVDPAEDQSQEGST